jgi:hypothetical protein
LTSQETNVLSQKIIALQSHREEAKHIAFRKAALALAGVCNTAFEFKEAIMWA